MDVNINIGTDTKKSQESFSYPCAFCKGSGKDPLKLADYNKTCPVCGGHRKNKFPGNKDNYSKCGSCRGTGRDLPHVNRPCRACHGKGVKKNI